MTNSEQKLRKANKELKDEVAEFKVQLEKVLKESSERTEECRWLLNVITLSCKSAKLCLQLFSALGVKGVLIQDIDMAH